MQVWNYNPIFQTAYIIRVDMMSDKTDNFNGTHNCLLKPHVLVCEQTNRNSEVSQAVGQLYESSQQSILFNLHNPGYLLSMSLLSTKA
jgi:hypothetical protein